MTSFTHYRDHVGSNPDKHFKSTLFEGAHLMVGLNCLEPGQIQPIHEHSSSDKVYMVLEGTGTFTIGTEVRDATIGEVIWAPSGLAHGVENKGSVRLVVFIGIAPPPS
jgi:quercetin dioxygenase-like cupin family protein